MLRSINSGLNSNCYVWRLKEAIRIFYDSLNCSDSRFYLRLHFLYDFSTGIEKSGLGMTDTLGSRVTGTKNVAIRSHTRLRLLSQFENGNLIDNCCTSSDGNATK